MCIALTHYHEGVETARATMVDLQRVRSWAMLEAYVNIVPRCFRYLVRTSLHPILCKMSIVSIIIIELHFVIVVK